MRALALGLCLAALAGCGRVPRVATSPAKDWTHRELLAHLNARGLGAWEGESGTEGRGERPYAYFFWDEDRNNPWPRGRVKVVLEATERDAKDRAGTDDGFAWGRFRFEGSADSLKNVRERLP